MLRVGSRFAKLPFAVFAVAMIALVVIGGIRTFSPVPSADMWDSGLAFVMRPAVTRASGGPTTLSATCEPMPWAEQ